ncbi:uncharacterized protein LOC116258564 isoform X2 [Nymphaea colorata]|nr:uncharacterized protein LOC116258564 isoform X2 [Nymphaea colorata]
MAIPGWSSAPLAVPSVSGSLPSSPSSSHVLPFAALMSYTTGGGGGTRPIINMWTPIRLEEAATTTMTAGVASLNWGRRGEHLRRFLPHATSADQTPLDLTEENVIQVLEDARSEFEQIFDTSVGMTGEAKLAELDGPFVKLSLKGRFWHKRSTVLARLGTYLKQRIPEILEVDIEDESQLDDSPASF